MKSSKDPIDPGWNDPPKFSYNETIEYTKSPKRNILNKRVAFPLNSSSTKTTSSSFKDPTAAPCSNPNLPPPPTNFIIPDSNLVANGITLEKCAIRETDSNILQKELQSDDTGSIAKQISIEEILHMLNSVIEEKREFLSNNNKEEHIKKKLQVLKDSWDSNKISDDIKNQIFELAKALRSGNKIRANQIQVALMVDYPQVCSEFISALRQLINIEENVQ